MNGIPKRMMGLLAALSLAVPQAGFADEVFTGEPGAGETAAAVQTETSKPMPGKYRLLYGAQRDGRRIDAAMQHFRDNRLGALVCWDLFSVPGGVWKGKTYSGAAEWLQQWARIPKDEYRALMKQWNPEQFDAGQWAKFFKHMGLKYIKITTKFHDGFCLWPSAYSDFTVADRLGAWLRINGRAVYGCGYAGLPKQDWGYYTKSKDGSINMVVFNPPYSGRLPITVPEKTALGTTAQVLGGGTVKLVRVGGSEWMAEMPVPRPDGPFVIRLTPVI